MTFQRWHLATAARHGGGYFLETHGTIFPSKCRSAEHIVHVIAYLNRGLKHLGHSSGVCSRSPPCAARVSRSGRSPYRIGTYMDPPALSRALEWTNTLRNRCSHISGLLGKTFPSLRALMQSALPHLITTAASWALSLRRLGGSRSDRSCHQFNYTSSCAERLLHILVK